MKTPQAIPGTVEMVSVEWAMKNLVDSIDGYGTGNGPGTVDFGRMVWYKSSDSQMGDLLATIMERGFRVPVCFYRDIYWDGWALGNGHHRMAAAILLCLDEIPVYWAGEGEGYMAGDKTETEGLVDGDRGLAEWLGEELRSLLSAEDECDECGVVHKCCCDCD